LAAANCLKLLAAALGFFVLIAKKMPRERRALQRGAELGLLQYGVRSIRSVLKSRSGQ